MNKIISSLGFVMAFLYLTVGVLLIFTGFLSDALSNYRDAIGALFILYGIFRVVMCIQKWRQHEEQ